MKTGNKLLTQSQRTMKLFSNTFGARLENDELKKQALTADIMLQVKGGDDVGSGLVRTPPRP